MRHPLGDALDRALGDDAESLLAIGRAALADGLVDVASEAAHRALRASPSSAAAALLAARIDALEGAFDRAAARLGPILARSSTTEEERDGLLLLAKARDATGDDLGRREALDAALRSSSPCAEIHLARADLALDEGDLARAWEELDRAEGLSASARDLAARRGRICFERGLGAEAVALSTRALALAPNDLGAHGSLLRAMARAGSADEDLLTEALVLDARHGRVGTAFARPAAADRERLRLVYLLPDRCDRIAPFLEPVLAERSRARFDVHLVQRRRRDEGAARLARLADGARTVLDVEDRDLARSLGEEGTDIVVAVGGLDSELPLGALLHRAAPVQLTFLADASCGLRALDGRITDDRSASEPDAERLHVERLLRIAGGDRAFRAAALPLVERPSGPVTFGAFAPASDLDDTTLSAFAEILAGVPGGRLRIANEVAEDAVFRARVLERARAVGVSVDRVAFATPRHDEERLALVAETDVVLEPLGASDPRGCCEAIWMGAALVALRGGRARGRFGAELLSRLSLAESIADSPAAFVAIARGWAADAPARAALRRTLRERFLASPLGDTASFVERYEAALELAWSDAARGATPPSRRLDPSARGESTRLVSLAGGLLARRETERASAIATRAILADPTDAEAHNVLGNTLAALGDEERAEEAWRRARACDPSLFKPLNNLASLVSKRGDKEEAIELFQRALALKPDAFRAHANLGATLVSVGMFDAASAHLRRSLEIEASPFALVKLAEVHLARDEVGPALGALEAATRLGPLGHEGDLVLAEALEKSGRGDESVRVLERSAERSRSRVHETEAILVALLDRGAYEAAARVTEAGAVPISMPLVRRLTSALERGWREDRVDAWLAEVAGARRMVAVVMLLADRLDRRRDDAALERALGRARTIFPGVGAIERRLGVLLDARGRHREASVHLRRALASDPLDVDAEWALLRIRGLEGDVDTAIRGLTKLASASPESDLAPTILAFMNYADSVDARAVFEAHRRWGERTERHVHRVSVPRRAERPTRLKIGYVSPDFREHSVARFIEPILRAHDRRRFEIHAYHTHRVRDAVTERLARLDLVMHHVADRSERELARQIADDGIDILVDLAGHTESSTLGVFARKPAPVQVTYLGYPGTTGLSAVDHRITDAKADPCGYADELSTERLVRLPTTAWCFGPPRDAPDPGASTRRSGVVFGSFNTLRKTTPRVVAAWSELCSSVPGSRLVLKTGGLEADEVRERLLAQFASHGVDRASLVLRGWDRDAATHLTAYREIDVALDPFPYGGTTTTCEALFMGVPVVTLVGDRHAGRVGLSLLSTIGLEALAAPTVDAYLETARALAEDEPRRAELRATLRGRMEATPLLDATRFVPEMEAAYDRMFEAYLARPEPKPEAARVEASLAPDLSLVLPRATPDDPSFDDDDLAPDEGFARRALAPGEKVVDVGAGVGAFTLTAAKAVGPGGEVVAIASDERARACLATSVSSNRLAWVRVEPAPSAQGRGAEGEEAAAPEAAETGPARDLAQLFAGAAFVRLSRREASRERIDLASRCDDAALVFDLADDDRDGPALLSALRERGKVLLEWRDAIRAFVPARTTARRPTLVAAPARRLEAFRARDLLATEEDARADLSPDAHAIAAFAALPYAEGFFGHPQRLPIAIRRHLVAVHGASASLRWTALKRAMLAAVRDVEVRPTVARRMTLARLTLDAGEVELGRELLGRLERELREGATLDLDEPFLCVLARYERFDGHRRARAFVLSQIAEARAIHRDRASAAAAFETIAMWRTVATSGFGGDAAERRLADIVERLTG